MGVKSPKIVMLLGVSIDERLAIIMEFVEGESLQQLIGRKELSEPEIIDISYQIAESVAYLHQKIPRGIVHRDLKPDNILITKKGEVKLCDLGTSKLLASTNIAPHTGIGTANYMPPEQFDRTKELGSGVDS